MACNLCQIPTSVSPLDPSTLKDVNTAATTAQDTTIMLACGNCNVNDFGPAKATAPSFKVSTST